MNIEYRRHCFSLSAPEFKVFVSLVPAGLGGLRLVVRAGDHDDGEVEHDEGVAGHRAHHAVPANITT